MTLKMLLYRKLMPDCQTNSQWYPSLIPQLDHRNPSFRSLMDGFRALQKSANPEVSHHSHQNFFDNLVELRARALYDR